MLHEQSLQDPALKMLRGPIETMTNFIVETRAVETVLQGHEVMQLA